MSKEKFTQVLLESKIILKEYDLCDNCLGRLFTKKLFLSSNKLLGKKIHNKTHSKSSKCFICKNLFAEIPIILNKILDESSNCQFSTFLIGAIVKPSIIDRDDAIRSKFSLRGIDSIKTAITKELTKHFSLRTKTTSDHHSPDLTITVNFKDTSVETRSKQVFIFGRYTKNSRLLPQKQTSCENCNGKGCSVCNHHGISSFNSVEGKISKFLYEKFNTSLVKISWIGGEDKTSLVYPPGRPFFAKIIDPKKRMIRFSKKITLQDIELLDSKIISSMPKAPIRFSSNIELSISTENPINSDMLKKLSSLSKSQVAIYDKFGKRTEKAIYTIRYKKTGNSTFLTKLKVEGGFPVRKFIHGDDVFPNLSDLLDNACRCIEFDFRGIELE